MKVLVSAYACEPGKGSEPGVGWSWANALAKDHDVWVMTRKNNLPTIFSWEEKYGKSKINWIGYDGPRWLCKFKKIIIKGDHLYYSWWQKAILPEVKKMHQEVNFDIIHHVTFVTHQYPCHLYKVGPPLVFGPLAGADCIPKHLRSGLSVKDKVIEKLRDIMLMASTKRAILRQSLSQAKVVVAANLANKEYLEKNFDISPVVHPAMMIEETLQVNGEKIEESSGLKLLTAGRLIGLKGHWLSISALQYLPETTTLDIVGEGEDEKMLKKLAQKIGVSSRITWHKNMEQAKLFEFMQKSDAFITPSLRDSGGMAALEALKCGCPVVAIALGGLNHSVKHGINGFLVQPSSVDEIEKNLAKYCQREKIKSLSSDAIIQSVRPFSRDALSEWTKELYSNILNSDNKR